MDSPRRSYRTTDVRASYGTNRPGQLHVGVAAARGIGVPPMLHGRDAHATFASDPHTIALTDRLSYHGYAAPLVSRAGCPRHNELRRRNRPPLGAG